MTDSPILAIHCEARKIAYRQTRDGLVVSFVIHPNDMPDTLATAPLGQRYMLALAAIGDDEQPIAPVAQRIECQIPDLEIAGSSPAGRTTSSERGKLAYANGTVGEKARTRAAMLPDDARFRAWAVPVPDGGDNRFSRKEKAEQFIRLKCCDGHSRSLIAEDADCLHKFLAMETQYLMETDQMAAPR